MNSNTASGIFIIKNIKYLILSACFYFLLLVPINYVLSILIGTETRIAVFLPAVLGIFWGPAGAVGIAIGKFMSDMTSALALYIAITNAIAHFFQAYIPYKLWHTFGVRKNVPCFYLDARDSLKFMYILIITLFVVNIMSAIAAESSKINFASEVFFLFLLQDIDIALFLGLPTLMILANSKQSPHLPRLDKGSPKSAVYYDALLYIIIMTGGTYMFISDQAGNVIHNNFAFVCWMGMFLLLSFFVQKPVIYQINIDKHKKNIQAPIKRKFIWIFFLIFIIFTVFASSIAYGIFQNKHLLENTQLWRYFYVNIVIAIHIIVILGITSLWYIDKKIIKPLQLLVEALEIMGTSQRQIKQLDIHTGNEIELVADSFHAMVKKLGYNIALESDAKKLKEKQKNIDTI